jgi:hypothetical protein
MVGSWKWKVESKDFELLVKDGANGARFFERNGKRQRSIFLLKDELAWLDRKGEELVKGDHVEVFWDQARAGYPRIMAQKLSNRNGNFLEIEEYDGRGRRGSVIIPEGRYGQGWERLKVHVSRANASLRVLRKVRESAMVTGRRSFAEVVGLSQNQSEECFNAYSEPIARIPLWLKECNDKTGAGVGCSEKSKKAGTGLFPVMVPWGSKKVLGLVQPLAKTRDGAKVEKKAGDGPVTAAGSRESGKAVVCAELSGRLPACSLSRPVASLNPGKALIPSISEKPVQERLIGREELVGDGLMSCVRRELSDIRRVLTDVMSEVEGGIKRVDFALGLLGCSGPKEEPLGSSVMVDPGSQVVGPKPKKNKKKKKKKGKPAAGSKPTLVSGYLEPCEFQVGGSSSAGASSSAGVVGFVSPSILGKYKCKAMGSAGKGASAPTSSKQNSEGGFAGGEVETATQTTPAVEPATQTTPTVAPGCFGGSEVAGPTPAISLLMPIHYDNLKGMPAGDDFHGKSVQAMTGGGFTAKELISGLKDSSLVPWHSRSIVLDRDGFSDSGGEGSADYSLSDCCVVQNEGEGEFMVGQQCFSPGLHMVPYVEEEPTPLNWSQALGGGESGGPLAAGKEIELIMATSRILGVSCDGHFEKLRAAYALILAGRPKKVNKKPVGGNQEGKKGLRELANLYSGVNYEGGSESVSRRKNKGRGNRLVL